MLAHRNAMLTRHQNGKFVNVDSREKEHLDKYYISFVCIEGVQVKPLFCENTKPIFIHRNILNFLDVYS